MSDEGAPCRLLKEPLSVSDLLGSGTKFEMNTDFDEGFINEIYEEVYGEDGEDDDGVEVNRNLLVSPWTKSFAELKTQMIFINEHISKKITDPGDKEKGLMPDNSRVCICYNAYWEGEGAPFDSSYLRGSNFSFYTGCGAVLEGLEKAVRTMYEGEKAQFVISYKLLFGEMGCPPRIRPRADGLFIIELMSFNAVGDVNAEQQLAEEDQKKYSVAIEKVKLIHLKGLDFFGQGMYKNAFRSFEKAVDVLNFCRLANEEEERDQQAFLIKLYTNLAVCYNKTNMPNKTCIVCREIRRLTKNKTSCKAIFQEGRALVMLGEYDKARELLLRAQHMEPQNEFITKEFKDLENRCKSYKESQKNIWQRALGYDDSKKEVVEDESCSVFKKNMTELLEEFQKSSIQENFKLPEGLNDQETKTIEELAKQFEMQLEFDHSSKTHSIRKKC